MPPALSECDLANYQLEHSGLVCVNKHSAFETVRGERLSAPSPQKWLRKEGAKAVMKPDLGSLSTMFTDCSTCYPCRTNVLPCVVTLPHSRERPTLNHHVAN